MIGDKALAVQMNKGIVILLISAIFFMICVGLSLGQYVDSDSPCFKIDNNSSGQSDIYTQDTNGTLDWSFNIPNGSSAVSQAVVDASGVIYFGTENGSGWNHLYALYSNGTEKWNYSKPDFDFYSSPCIDSNGYIYLATYNDGFGENPAVISLYPNGTQRWSNGSILGGNGNMLLSPKIDEGILYVGDINNFFHAVYTSNGTEKWNYDTGVEVYGSPVFDDDYVYFTSKSTSLFQSQQRAVASNIYCLYKNNGTLKWRLSPSKDMEVSYSSPSMDANGILYVGNKTGVMALYSSNGTEKWFYTVSDVSDNGVVCSPSINSSDNTIYFTVTKDVFGGSTNDDFIALYPNGTLKWNYTLLTLDVNLQLSSPVIGADGTIYTGISGIQTDYVDLLALNSNGTKKWNYSIPGLPSLGPDNRIFSTPTITENHILIGTDKLYAFENPTVQPIAPTKPGVTSTTPSNGATDVQIDTTVVIVFNKSMNTSVTPTLQVTAGTDTGGWSFSGWTTTTNANDTASWTHTDWYKSDSITLKVSGYKSTGGLTGDPYSFSFETESIGDVLTRTLAPLILVIVPIAVVGVVIAILSGIATGGGGLGKGGGYS